MYIFPPLLPSQESYVMGGVCVGSHKTFTCVRVSTPRLCAFSSARRFHTWHSAFFCQTRLFLPRNYTRFRKENCGKTKIEAEQPVPVRAAQESHCKVRALPGTSLLCAATFMLLQLLCFVSAWSFGIFDIFRIFPLLLHCFGASCV